MLSLWDLEGIPRGMGSGSCNAGRTELPDLGTDIVDIPKSFEIYTNCAQTKVDLVANGDDWNAVSAAEQTQGLYKSHTTATSLS